MSLKKLIFLFLLSFNQFALAWFFSNTPQPFVLMLEASGDSMQTGRIIDDSFETTIAYNFAQNLKSRLQAASAHLKIMLNRNPGERVAPLQNATVANRLHVNLYVSIHFFEQKDAKPTLYIYQLSYHDSCILKKNDLNFYPIDMVYLLHQTITDQWAQQIKKTLSIDPAIAVYGPYKLPSKPLIGINAPAIAFEIGIHHKNDWQPLIEPLAKSLEAIITG